MDAEAALINSELDAKLQELQEAADTVSQGRLLAVVTVLLSRCSTNSHIAAVTRAVPGIELLLQSDDQTIQANACAALTAAAALEEKVAATVATTQTPRLIQILQECSTTNRSDVQLNVVSALGQLARDEEVTAQALVEPQALGALLSLASKSQPAKLQEAVADSLCALAANEWAREQLCRAGVIQPVAALLSVQQLEVSVRCLMVLGMLLPTNPEAARQLTDNAAAVQQLMALLKQNDDMDCKVIARDIISVLLRDEVLRSRIEAAVRQPTQVAA